MPCLQMQKPWKSAKAVDFHTDRRTLLEQIGLGAWCDDAEKPCKLSVRGFPWEQQDFGLRRLIEGDLVEIEAGIPWPNIPLLVQWHMVQEGCDIADIPDRHRRSSTANGENRENSSPASNGTIHYNAEAEEEAVGLMQTMPRNAWFYLYRVGTEEPDADKLNGDQLNAPKREIDQRLRARDPLWRSDPGRIFFVTPPPADLARNGVTAVLLARADAVDPGTSIIMVDVEVMNPQLGRPQD